MWLDKVGNVKKIQYADLSIIPIVPNAVEIVKYRMRAYMEYESELYFIVHVFQDGSIAGLENAEAWNLYQSKNF